MPFTTLVQHHTDEIIEKKSRFIADAFPIRSVADAEAAIQLIRDQHPGARHHVYAYRIGVGVPYERFSDDGEPSGTAGRPVLEVLRRQGIDNALVVVTRYFGGILLGANGLVRAYTEAAAAALSAAPKLACQPMVELNVTCDYSHYGKLEYQLAQTGVALRNPAFAETVSFQLIIPAEEADSMTQQLADWTGGQAHIECHPPVYMGLTPSGEIVRDVWVNPPS
ncbi:YigZ family protein [Alicyclobacillus hesperidum subsp. aegles]|uniref:YigZ family protein n=1 Tax=Alicyclobacillus hesperidum TaxID=89784 RepID=UPI00222DF3A0|nr:YigZ family protein [Alicyclobacillus hesperidum]GLG02033.1 YigZ family protein [Alicyclobacillus hesperidum subsp. aegles]